MASRCLRLLLLADTHECHRSLEIPQKPDLVLFAGDLCMMSRSMGGEGLQFMVGRSRSPCCANTRQS
jgi:hypothetical protein